MQVEPNIPMIDNSTKDFPNVGIGLYLALMGTFNFPPLEVCMICYVWNEPSTI